MRPRRATLRPVAVAAVAVGAALALAAAACTAPAGPPARPPRVDSGVADLERIALPPSVPAGLSDLSHDGAGRLLAIAERHRALVELDPRGVAPRVLPLDGVPPDLDTESLAWLGDG